jgi:isopentenyldiphosphate isomerase
VPVTASAAHEPVEIVDDDDQVIAVVPRAEIRARRLQHRAVFVAVLSTDGRLLVHRRADDNDVWPGWWDLAVGGVVAAGESYDDAAVRELAEEIGVTGVVPEPLGGGRFVDESVALLGRCYRVVHDGPFTFDDGEVVEARWATPDELRELMNRLRFLPDSVDLLLPLLAGFADAAPG